MLEELKCDTQYYLGTNKGTRIHNHLVRKQPFSQTGLMNKLCHEYYLYGTLTVFFLDILKSMSEWTSMKWTS